ncbi:hypothetical protein I4U23_020151 [Adineta vaga]|nr:hypothetical protein I4U23_020151 [Adineta vaga]
MNSFDNYYINIINLTTTYLFEYVLPVLYIISNLGNLLSVLVFSQKSWRKNVCVFYFKIFLLYNTVLLNSATLGLILNIGYKLNLQNFNIILCKGYFYMSFLFATLSPTILILASLDRLLISSQNIDTRLYSSKRLAYFSISISTLFWMIFYIHLLSKVNIYEFTPSHFVCYFDSSKLYMIFVSYSTSILNIVFDILMIILCIFAFKNVRHIRAVPSDRRNQIRSMKKKDFQLLRCLFVQDIIFLIFETPVTVFYTYDTLTKSYVRTRLEQAIHTFSHNILSFLHHTFCLTAFFIFIIVSKAFRTELKRMFYKFIGKERSSNRENEHVVNAIVLIN